MKNIKNILINWGFNYIEIVNRYHEDSTRQIYLVSAQGKHMLLKGISDEKPESTINNNILAHEFLGNQKNIAPKIICTPDGKKYIYENGFWFYLMEFIEGRLLEEDEKDEYELGKLAKQLHTFRDYQILSSFNQDKDRFYEWFVEKEFKKEFDEILDKLPDFKNYEQCFVHTDLGPHNSIMRQNGKIVLIDLDDAGLGSKYLDLGWPFIMQFVDFNHETDVMKYRFELACAFLQGYYENEKLLREEYDLLWQGAIYMHISYMKTYGPYAVDSLWSILKYGIEQKEKLWDMINSN